MTTHGGFFTAEHRHGDVLERQVTVLPFPGEGPASVLARLIESVGAGRVALLLGFGPANLEPALRDSLRSLGVAPVPFLWVPGGNALQGLQATVYQGAEVETTLQETGLTACRVRDGLAETVFVATDAGLCPSDQGEEWLIAFLEQARIHLEQLGLSLRHVARTWFYPRDILGWYGAFNGIRTRIYRETGILDGVVPASTGIGLDGRAPFPLVAGLVALKPVHPQVGVRRVASPLQPEASTYGSTFSRALEVRFPGSRRLHVSGTAAIDAAGRSMHHGDTAGQVRATLDVLRALLAQEGMALSDVSRAVCYFRNPGDIAPFLDSDEGRELGSRAVCCHQTICRDDLLFEVEADALLSR